MQSVSIDELEYYPHDALGSVTGIRDDSGDLVEGYLYDPYGQMYVVLPGSNGDVDWGSDDTIAAYSSIGNPYGYTSQRFDPETGLMYYKARYYSPEQGRFISRDPIGAWGDAGNLGNGYAYVGLSPLNAVDPSGTLVALVSGADGNAMKRGGTLGAIGGCIVFGLLGCVAGAFTGAYVGAQKGRYSEAEQASYWYLYQSTLTGPAGPVEYYNWQEGSRLKQDARAASLRHEYVVLIGHSYGAQTIVNAVNELGICVDLAVSIDRVDSFRVGAAYQSFSDNARYSLDFWQNDHPILPLIRSERTGGASEPNHVTGTSHNHIKIDVRSSVTAALNHVTAKPPCSASEDSQGCWDYVMACGPRFNELIGVDARWRP